MQGSRVVWNDQTHIFGSCTGRYDDQIVQIIDKKMYFVRWRFGNIQTQPQINSHDRLLDVIKPGLYKSINCVMILQVYKSAFIIQAMLIYHLF